MSLFDAAKPLILPLKLYGFNLGNEKKTIPARCFEIIIKIFWKLHIVFLLWRAWEILSLDLSYDSANYIDVSELLLALVSSFVYYVAFDGKRAEVVMERMKRHQAGKMSQKKIGNNLIAFKVFAVFYVSLMTLTNAFLFWYSPSVLSVFDFSAEGFLWKNLQLFPTIVTFIPCLVCAYCSSRVEELSLKLSRARSPLRRSRMMNEILNEYYELYHLATLTNRLTARAMSIVKAAFLLLAVMNVILFSTFPKELYECFCNCGWACAALFCFLAASRMYASGFAVVNLFPVVHYMYVAPPANRMFSVISKSFARCVLVDSEWHSRDPASRSHLTRMRLNQLTHLVHIGMDEPAFSVMGEPVEDGALISLFLEGMDLYNTLSVLRDDKPMIITRVVKRVKEEMEASNYLLSFS